MGDEGDTSLLDGIVTAAFRRRDEDDIRIGGKNQFCVEVTFHTDLHDLSVLDPLQDVLIKQILGAGDALHHIMGIECGKVRQLKGRHADGIINRYTHLYIIGGYRRVVGMYQSKTILFPDFHETDIC